MDFGEKSEVSTEALNDDLPLSAEAREMFDELVALLCTGR